MTPEEASKIVQIWGRYLEHIGGKLTMFFCACIPESFLPFPKDTLEKALNMVAEHYHNEGNQKAVNDLQASIAHLLAYKDDEEAVSHMAKLFDDPEWRKDILPHFKEFQKEWIKTQGDFKELK